MYYLVGDHNSRCLSPGSGNSCEFPIMWFHSISPIARFTFSMFWSAFW